MLVEPAYNLTALVWLATEVEATVVFDAFHRSQPSTLWQSYGYGHQGWPRGRCGGRTGGFHQQGWSGWQGIWLCHHPLQGHTGIVEGENVDEGLSIAGSHPLGAPLAHAQTMTVATALQHKRILSLTKGNHFWVVLAVDPQTQRLYRFGEQVQSEGHRWLRGLKSPIHRCRGRRGRWTW